MFLQKIFNELDYPCFSTSFAKVFINDKFHGLFLEVENMDKDFLKNNGLNTKGDLFKATKDGACLHSVEELEKKWEKKTNKNNDFTPLEQLISDTKDLPDNEFYDFVLNNFHYSMLIDFLAINSFIANGSTYYHNYYLYQDFANSGKWIFYHGIWTKLFHTIIGSLINITAHLVIGNLTIHLLKNVF